MGQEDEFYDEKMNELKYGGGIWNLLSSVLHFTEEQKKSIIGSRAGEGGEQHGVDAETDARHSRHADSDPASTVFDMGGRRYEWRRINCLRETRAAHEHMLRRGRNFSISLRPRLDDFPLVRWSSTNRGMIEL